MAKFRKMSDMTADYYRLHRINIETEHERIFTNRILEMLQRLEDRRENNGLNQLQHSLQMATFAQRDGADDETVFCALCHDIGKFVSRINHASIGAEILKPFVSRESYLVLLNHDVFQAYHYNEYKGLNKNEFEKFRDEPWFPKALKFTAWDCEAFDPDHKTISLSDFESLIFQYTARFPKKKAA